MTREDFEELCVQNDLIETDSASVEIQYDDEGVYLTVRHKRVDLVCEAYHRLFDDEFLTASVQRFAQFIKLTETLTELPAPI
jgi:hypothetical protein